jgi:hypothetical protein
MTLLLALLLGVVPTIALPALLIGLVVLTTRRKSQPSETPPLADPGPGVVPAPADRPPAAMAVDLQLTTVLAESGEILLGYRTSEASAAGRRSSTDVFPLATGILLVRPSGEDCDAVVSTLERWSKDGIELALRTFDDAGLVVLCDRRTSQRLVLSLLRAPCR